MTVSSCAGLCGQGNLLVNLKFESLTTDVSGFFSGQSADVLLSAKVR